jgi:hypothetical protein
MNDLQAALFIKYLANKEKEPRQVLCWVTEADTYMGKCIEEKLENKRFGVYSLSGLPATSTPHLLSDPTKYMIDHGFCCHGCGRPLKFHE